MWLGGEDRELWFGYEGSGCQCEGQVRGLGVTNRMAVKLEQGIGNDGLGTT